MNNEVPHILSYFDESDFKDFDMELWKSRFYGDTLVMYFGDKYIAVEDIFAIAANGKKVQINDIKNF